MLLEENGYRVLTATNRTDALQAFLSHPVDLVLLELSHARYAGDMVATRMKDSKPGVPVALLSSDERLPTSDLEAVDCFMRKSWLIHRLLKKVDYLVSLVFSRPANVVFHADLGRRAKVGNVEAQGAEPAEAHRLLHAARSLSGDCKRRFSQTWEVVYPELMKQDLVRHQHLESKVHLDQSRYHPDTNHTDLIIGTRPGPVVKVRVLGIKLSWASVPSWKANEKTHSDIFRGDGGSRSRGRRPSTSNRFLSEQGLL
jgi:CheY-like chemotaxis protein